MIREVLREKIYEAKSQVSDLKGTKKDLYTALLDNQLVGLEKIAEKTTTANIDRVVNVFIPTIKKLVRDSIIQNLVGVQPIQDRVALVYYFDIVKQGTNQSILKPNTPIQDNAYSEAPPEGENVNAGLDVIVREFGVTAKTRKLTSKWTFESQDSLSKLGFNIENEIVKAVASLITREINDEILYDLLNGATGGTATWNMPAPNDPPAVKDRAEKELYFTIIQVAGQIYSKTLRYPNWIVCSQTTADILARTVTYVPDPEMSGIKALYQAGTLQHRFTMYTVPGFPDNKILIGYKGPSEVEAGYIYAPYIPLVIMDSFFNPENWTWIKSIGSFYAKVMVMSDLYGIVNIQ